MRKLGTVALAVGLAGGCANITPEEKVKLQADVATLQKRTADMDQRIAKLSKMSAALDEQQRQLQSVLDQATKLVTHNSANLGLTVEELRNDLAQLHGKFDEISQQFGNLSKNFTDYRAQSSTALEQIQISSTNSKAPPVPEKADDVYDEGQRAYDAKNWQEARRLWTAFSDRFASDPRAPKVQYLIADSYFKEQRWANAIVAFTKVIDNWPKSESVPDAMFMNGQAFYALGRCADARVYFEELLRRYPHTDWKKDVSENLHKLSRDMKDKKVCPS